jgi:hypothetical protein
VEAYNQCWLTWQTNGLEHGIRKHKFDPETGAIREIEDIKIRPKKKDKRISSRQWDEGRQSR